MCGLSIPMSLTQIIFLKMDSPEGATVEPRNGAFQKVIFQEMDSPEGATTEPRNKSFSKNQISENGFPRRGNRGASEQS